MPDPSQELARTRSALPDQPVADNASAAHESWQNVLGQLEMDVSRAEQLAVGTRMISGQVELAETGDESVDADAFSDGLLARLSIPLPDGPPWEPPHGQPPMPAEYAERARAVLDRQIAIAAHIAREITMGRQHAAYAHHLEELEDVKAAPAFIDQVT